MSKDMINERLLQYIWQFQHFHQQHLCTTNGEPLRILHKGTWNCNQGPDFLHAQVRIGDTIWVGNIELHIQASDWFRHGHRQDEQYANVVLHVVWENDKHAIDAQGVLLPTLVLEPLVPSLLLERYRHMMKELSAVACDAHLPALGELHWCAWKERLAMERLQRKTEKLLRGYEAMGRNWDALCWQQLALVFGARINGDLFEWVAASATHQVWARYATVPDQLEALMMGQANLLEGHYKDQYPQHLQQEFRHLNRKHRLQRTTILPSFLRMRPASFPTIRLSQLAMLRHRHPNLPTLLRETTGLKEVMALFQVKASPYWNDHYVFDEQVMPSPKFIGQQMCTQVFLNAVIPMLFLHGGQQGIQVLKDRALQWLYALPPEQNRYTRYWQSKGVSNHSGLDSQALLELNLQYCVNKRCLDCAVGNKLIR